jgi:hypothetical protein
MSAETGGMGISSAYSHFDKERSCAAIAKPANISVPFWINRPMGVCVYHINSS